MLGGWVGVAWGGGALGEGEYARVGDGVAQRAQSLLQAKSAEGGWEKRQVIGLLASGGGIGPQSEITLTGWEARKVGARRWCFDIGVTRIYWKRKSRYFRKLKPRLGPPSCICATCAAIVFLRHRRNRNQHLL